MNDMPARPLSAYFLSDDIDNETVAERLLLEDTGVLTDRELRWVLESMSAEAEQLSSELSPTNACPTALYDTANFARAVAGLLDRWARQIATVQP